MFISSAVVGIVYLATFVLIAI